MVYFEIYALIRDDLDENVSILVLMDGVLRDIALCGQPHRNLVSILVLMDGVLRGEEPDAQESCFICFNPCSNGWCTSSCNHGVIIRRLQQRFNPCSNGWCTSRFATVGLAFAYKKVSILVLMDGVLRDRPPEILGSRRRCFNPCSNGWCTSSASAPIVNACELSVSILVLMDGVLRVCPSVSGSSLFVLFQSLF